MRQCRAWAASPKRCAPKQFLGVSPDRADQLSVVLRTPWCLRRTVTSSSFGSRTVHGLVLSASPGFSHLPPLDRRHTATAPEASYSAYSPELPASHIDMAQASRLRQELFRTRLEITLVRSLIRTPESQRKVAEVLGLRKTHKVRVHQDAPRVWGMIEKINHLVQVRRIPATPQQIAEAEARAVAPLSPATPPPVPLASMDPTNIR